MLILAYYKIFENKKKIEYDEEQPNQLADLETEEISNVDVENSKDAEIDELHDIFHPDDIQKLYQNKGKGLTIPTYNRVQKKRARTENEERLQNIKEYCQKALPTNRYLRLANQHVEDTNKFLYFDFYYSFLYCQTQKVTIMNRYIYRTLI